jgi:hypothetical protein
VIENESGIAFRSCKGSGRNYYRTFDGLEYLFPGRCAYTLFEDGTRSVQMVMVNCARMTTCQKV